MCRKLHLFIMHTISATITLSIPWLSTEGLDEYQYLHELIIFLNFIHQKSPYAEIRFKLQKLSSTQPNYSQTHGSH